MEITIERSSLENTPQFEIQTKRARACDLSEFTSLDVGCGHKSEGDVGVDLFLESTSHRCGDQRKNTHYPLLSSEVSNLVRCECTKLPFKDNIFTLCISNSLIEHIDEPFLFAQGNV